MSDWTTATGRVVVNDGQRIIDHDDVKVWDIDLTTKYAEVVGYGTSFGDDGGVSVMLGASERTLYLDADETLPTMTILSFALPGWSIMADIGRYTLRVVAYDTRVQERGSDLP